MVDIEGNLRPFRIDMQNFMDLVSHISQKLNDARSPTKRIHITVMRFSKNCSNVDEMIAFLKDIHMPKVAKELTFWIYGQTGLTVHFYFCSEFARYSISDAEDMNQARSMEDTITEFFKKHTTSRFFSPFVAIFLGLSLFFVAVIGLANVVSSYLQGSVPAYRPLVLLTGICAAVLFVYVAWSGLTAEPPPISFVHSIVYIDKPPNHALWFLLFTILAGIVVSVISNWIS